MANALAPLRPSHAFRKYDSTSLASVTATLWKLANSGNGSGEAHHLAARKTDMKQGVRGPLMHTNADFSTGPLVKREHKCACDAMRREVSRSTSLNCPRYCRSRSCCGQSQ
jgi:hypothetical protein